MADTLLPALESGDIVVMDSLSVHDVKRVRQMIAAVGVRLLSSLAYSLDVNTTEYVVAKLKALLRTAAARAVPDMDDTT